MRVPLSWLREYCDPALDVHGIEERLTMTGTKVEAIHSVGPPEPEGFVVGRILKSQPHPDADRLSVCQVELGEARPEGPATVVCGAPNVAAGQNVAVALPGARMPDGTKLRKTKLRGVASEGMILAEDELELGTLHEGIMVLDDLLPEGAALAPGTALAEVLPLGEQVLELEITPNRADCLGLYGIARELHAASGSPLALAPWDATVVKTGLREEQPWGSALAHGSDGAPALQGELELPGEQPLQVSLDAPELCPRFTARVFADVTIGPSPLWLKARLIAAGQRPINNVVDITNYVMLLTGQPLHAFDLDRIAGHRLIVRRAAAGEQILTLDDQTRTLDEAMIVIEDGDGPTSIAGLMGGARSEVHDGTRRIVLEAACWDGPSIHRASWLLGLRSEASSRFEKGLAPEQCRYAQVVAEGLLADCAGARPLERAIDLGWQPSPAPVIRLRNARLDAILGMPVRLDRQRAILESLDFRVLMCGNAEEPERAFLEVSVPALRRSDVTREIDLIEEVARINGLERLPATLPARRGAAGRLSPAQRARRAVEDALAARGLYEIVGWSFTDPGLPDRLRAGESDPLRRLVRIENPLSEALSVMRPTLLGSLLDAARHNLSRDAPEVAIFESGTVYRALERATDERATNAGATDPDGQPADPDGQSADPGASGDTIGADPELAPVEEHHALGVLLAGPLTPRSWRSAERRQADFFAAKALLEVVLETLRVPWSVEPAQFSFLQPGRAAVVLAPDGPLGFLGELHPLVAGHWDLPSAAVFELDLDRLVRATPASTRFAPFPAVPPIRRDLAVTLPADLHAEQALETIRTAAGELLREARIFDVYTGEQVGSGGRSLAIALTFQAVDKTLTEADVAPLWERITRALAEIGGELRG